MKYSKIVLGSFLSVTLFGIACDNKYKTNLPDQNDVKPSVIDLTSSSGSGLGIISTPRPASSIDDASPKEPSPLPSLTPFIIGRPPAGFSSGGAAVSSSASPNPIVVKAKIKGQVMGYDINTKNYHPLPNARLLIGTEVLTADSGGRYTTENEITELVNISASASGFLSSTMSDITPGENRDIHLQPLDNRQRFNSNTISVEVTSLAGEQAAPLATDSDSSGSSTTDGEAVAKKYPSFFSFGDVDNSKFIPTLLNPETGLFRLEINPISNKTTAIGKLLVYDIERDSLGRPTNPTQMRVFQSRDITFRVGQTIFPADENSTVNDSSDSEANALNKFVNINANFYDSYGFSNFVCNAYVIFPTGEKVLASQYTGGAPTKISFRMPKITGVSYTIEAHAGTASRGSDVVVNDLHEGDSVEAYLLKPPSGLSPDYNTVAPGTAPEFKWEKIDDARGYQAEINSTDTQEHSGWEGFTTATTIKYPADLNRLKLGSQYRFQVAAMDFYFGGLSILNKAEELKAEIIKNDSKDFPFRVQLANHNTKTLPKGYRVSYDTVLFRAK